MLKHHRGCFSIIWVRSEGSGPFCPSNKTMEVLPVEDEDWRKMYDSFQAASNPAKWKFQMVTDSGAYTKVWFDGCFMTNYHGKTCKLVPLSGQIALNRAGALFIPHGGNPDALPDTHERFWEHVDGQYTGNRHSRPCHVKVPTAPGQPVRG